ncbi:MAG: ABC transporter ATP-binding protein [Deltaproteobacteria bacterium]|jgi:ABC-2 type transport system ATP-binding protein|nr:ABC transporter ATP-binding protein [Deltaproteobacteria bacterium]
MITVTNLSKNFKEIPAVRNVSFEITEHEIVGFLGPNGAGKTTTMRMLTTFIQPTQGKISIAGYSRDKEPDKIRKNIGYLPEIPPLYPELTVKEYLVFVAKLRSVCNAQLKLRLEEVLELCGLADFQNRVCGVLSKGYKQRVGLAQAIIHNPQVIILDEPTSGLDPLQIIEIRKLIKELGKQHTLILSSHILQEVTEVCSRVLIMAQGKIMADDQVATLTQAKTLEQIFIEAVSE